jgi:hypothetical protein
MPPHMPITNIVFNVTWISTASKKNSDITLPCLENYQNFVPLSDTETLPLYSITTYFKIVYSSERMERFHYSKTGSLKVHD